MLQGFNELQVWKGCQDGTEILRYYPDDGLSAKVGLITPKKLQIPLRDRNNSLSFAAPHEPNLLSSDNVNGVGASDGIISVQVEASVVDIEDIRLFNGKRQHRASQNGYGTFFAGRVARRSNGRWSQEHIVGWYPEHTHRKLYEHLPQFRELRNQGNSPAEAAPAEAASAYAAMVVASCAIDGIARARRGETVSLDFGGPVIAAIEQVCAYFGVDTVNLTSHTKADFCITFDEVRRRPSERKADCHW